MTYVSGPIPPLVSRLLALGLAERYTRTRCTSAREQVWATLSGKACGLARRRRERAQGRGASRLFISEEAMAWDTIEGKWKEMTGKVRERWG
jgi:hypothetical protein